MSSTELSKFAKYVSVSNTGAISLNSSYTLPTTVGANNNVLAVTNSATGELTWVSFTQASTGILNVVEDTTPQLGGDLEAYNQSIKFGSGGPVTDTFWIDSTGIVGKNNSTFSLATNPSGSNANITISAASSGTGDVNLWAGAGTGGAGSVVIKGGTSVTIQNLTYPNSDGANGQVLSTNGAGTLSWSSFPASGIFNIVEDTTPQLGGNLDLNGSIITDSSATDPGHFKIYDVAGQGTAVEIKGGTGQAGGVTIKQASSAQYGLVVKDDIDQRVIYTYGNQAYINELAYPTADGTSGQVLTTNGTGALSFTTPTGISSVLDDTSPELGANLNTRGFGIEFRNNAQSPDRVLLQSGGGTWNMTLPSTAGTSGQVLTTNGSGGLSWTTVSGGAEVLTTITNATGTVTHDTSTSSIFYHTSPSANFIANFTNVATTNSRVTSVVLVIQQGVTARMPTSVQINGVGSTPWWQGSTGVAPTGTSQGIDIVSFSLLRTSTGLWRVIGSSTGYFQD